VKLCAKKKRSDLKGKVRSEEVRSEGKRSDLKGKEVRSVKKKVRSAEKR
jgi:hypothetical protein